MTVVHRSLDFGVRQRVSMVGGQLGDVSATTGSSEPQAIIYGELQTHPVQTSSIHYRLTHSPNRRRTTSDDAHNTVNGVHRIVNTEAVNVQWVSKMPETFEEGSSKPASPSTWSYCVLMGSATLVQVLADLSVGQCRHGQGCSRSVYGHWHVSVLDTLHEAKYR